MSITFNLVKVTEFLLFGEKELLTRLSSVIPLFVKICLFIFPFNVWDKLSVLIRPVPELSLLH